jgi:hypothetical protein
MDSGGTSEKRLYYLITGVGIVLLGHYGPFAFPTIPEKRHYPRSSLYMRIEPCHEFIQNLFFFGFVVNFMI